MIRNFSNNFFENVKVFINMHGKGLSYEKVPEFTLYIKYSIATYNILLGLLIILIIVNFILNLFHNGNKFILKSLWCFNMFFITTITTLIMLKFYIALKVENSLGTYFLYIRKEFFLSNNNLGLMEHFSVLSTSFSDGVIILMLFVGLVCLDIISSKDFFRYVNNLNIFFCFMVFVVIMVSTNNLLIMFISFDFIFLPTVYFAHKLGYSKKSDKAVSILFYWTLFGSLLVLSSLSYLYYKYNTLNYNFLSKQKFSKYENILLFSNFTIGFGTKIPLAPFHHWLLKVHVEAPTAFSMFLSGFLVKSALYCLYTLLSIFKYNDLYILFVIWIIYSLLLSTLGLARQTDIKKLIAWATIQEMSFMLLFLMFKQLFLTNVCILFIILHGMMSSLMFYIVDILQRRYNTRSVKMLKSTNLYFPELTKYIWFLILLFSGFPFTVKFFIEWNLVALSLDLHYYTCIIVVFFINFLSVIFFCKFMFDLLYGIPESLEGNFDFIDIQKKEKTVLNFLSFFIMLLTFMFYFIEWKKKN